MNELPRKLPNGNLLVPALAQAGSVAGDGAKEITPADPEYQRWEEYLAARRNPPNN